MLEPFQCSRHWTQGGPEWGAALARAERVGPGGAGIGTFMSPCEKACGNAIFTAGGSLIVLSPEGFADRWHPERNKEALYAPVAISNCAARGDVRSAGSDYGGFVGRLAHASATIDDCWSSGAVWGTGGNIGSFVGNRGSGTITNCAASAYANGLRLFCGNSTAITGDRLSQAEVKARSADWPSVPKRSKSSAMIPISTAKELLAVRNNLAGRYVLTADIDFEGETIEPIGNYGTAFTGEFYLADWTNPVPMRHVDQDDAWKPEDDLNRDQMFFRWKIDLERTDD